MKNSHSTSCSPDPRGLSDWATAGQSVVSSSPVGTGRAPAKGSAIFVRRYNEIIALRKSGKTLHEIGLGLGLTKQRVLQIITKPPVERVFKPKKIRIAESKEEKNIRYLEHWGHDVEAHLAMQKLCADLGRAGYSKARQPISAFSQQRTGARIRGVEWKFTLPEWWAFWQASGKWELRGQGRGYAMCRFGDAGPYSSENCYIASGSDNARHLLDRIRGQYKFKEFSTPRDKHASTLCTD